MFDNFKKRSHVFANKVFILRTMWMFLVYLITIWTEDFCQQGLMKPITGGHRRYICDTCYDLLCKLLSDCYRVTWCERGL